MREVHTYKLGEINKTRNKREISRMCTPVPRIKCPCTLLAGRYRLTHEAAYHNNNAKRLWRVVAVVLIFDNGRQSEEGQGA